MSAGRAPALALAALVVAACGAGAGRAHAPRGLTAPTASAALDAGAPHAAVPGPSETNDAGARAASTAVVDLHVDLAYALGRGARLDDDASEVSARRLAAGGASRIVVPLFVEDAHAMTPAAARAAYEAAYARLVGALGRTPIAPAVALSFEGADGFADDPRGWDAWAARGACVVGLVHVRSNALAGSATDPSAQARARGLTPAGRRLAERVVAAGGVLDLAHASDAAQDELAAIARARGAPVVVTHTGMRALAPSGRNLDDARARLVAETGGVIGVSIHSGHVSARPGERATLDDVVRHLEHAIAVAGEDHVAIGSDLAGAIEPPSDADGAATWPALARLLRARGWSDARVAAVLSGNAERVLGAAAARGCAAIDARPVTRR